MSPDKFQRLMQLFQQALELSEHERSAFIERSGEGDLELVAELRALLGGPTGSNTRGARPNPVVTGAGLAAFAAGEGGVGGAGGLGGRVPRAGLAALPPAPVPELSGNYRLMRVIGEGGMGIVYEAEQAFPRRRVAIKALKPGLGGASILRRFQNEAQVLARLQHPGIAQVYEAGSADAESTGDDAFFVMEFVDGLPLNTYCETNTLSTSQRLDLMLKVCDAVQHAHQRGVIHRDLKPANILVAATDHGPQPKVLDFGVARVEDVRQQFTTVHTHVGQIIGTLAYMSPEQLVGTSGEAADIDVRADVYALGVVLYQLLTGKLPLELSNQPLPEIARIVRDEMPTKLSVIDRTLRGDLEVIVSKAIEKDRERRYSSAAALAEDIRRFLAGEPILARRDSTGYVLSKLVRKHKLPVALAAIALCGVVAFGFVAALQARANRILAASLADELHHSRIERGRLTAATGNTTLSEDMLWQQWVRRPGDTSTHWALRELYARTPLLASGPMLDGVPSRIAFSVATDSVVVSSVDGTINLLSPTLDLLVGTISPTLSGTLTALCVSPDGQIVVLGSSSGAIAALELSTRTNLFRIDREKRSFQFIGFAPDGQTFYSADSTGELIRCDARTGEVVATIARINSPSALIATPDHRVLVGTRVGQIHVVDALRQRTDHVIQGLPSSVASLATSADGGTLLAITDPSALYVIDTRSWSITRRVETGPGFRGIELIDDDRQIVMSGTAGIRVLDPRTMSIRHTLLAEDGGPIALHPTGRGIYTLAHGPTPRFVPTSPSPFSADWNQSGAANSDWIFTSALSPGARHYATGSARGDVRLWDLVYKKLVAELDGRGAIRTVAFDHSGDLLYVGGEGDQIRVLASADLRLIRQFKSHEKFTYDIVALPGGDVISVGADSHIRRYTSGGEMVLARLIQDKPNTTGAIRLSLSPDAKLIAVSGSSPSLWVGSTADFSTIYERRAPFGFMRTRFSPDGSLLASSGNFHSIEVRDTRSFEVLRTFRGHEGPVVEVAFDPTSTILYSSGIDSTIRVWDPRAGHNLATFAAPARETSTIRPLPDAQTIMIAGSDGQVRSWDFGVLDAAIARTTTYQLGRIPARNPVADADLPGLRAWSEAALRNNPSPLLGPDNTQNAPDPP